MARQGTNVSVDLNWLFENSRRNKLEESNRMDKIWAQSRQIYSDLLDSGAHPSHAAQLANEFLRTGNYQYPSETYDMKKVSPRLFPQGEVPVRVPLRGGQGAIGVYDAQNPTKMDLLDVPRGVNVRSLIAKNKPIGGSGSLLNRLTPYQKLAYSRIQQAMKLGQENLDESAIASLQEDIKVLPPEIQAEIEAGFEPDQVIPGEEPSGFAKFFGAKREDTVVPGKPVVRFKPKGESDLKAKATEWLTANGQMVTDRNIEAVIKAGKVR